MSQNDSYIDLIENNIDYFNDIIDDYISYDFDFDMITYSKVSESVYIYYEIFDDEVEDYASKYSQFKIRISNHDMKSGDDTFVIAHLDMNDVLNWYDVTDDGRFDLEFDDAINDNNIIFEFNPNDNLIELEIKNGIFKIEEKIENEL